MGLFDTECDRAVEQKIGADYNIWLDFGSVQLKVLMLQSRSWIFARIKSTPIPYFSWLLIDIRGHENILLRQKIQKSLYTAIWRCLARALNWYIARLAITITYTKQSSYNFHLYQTHTLLCTLHNDFSEHKISTIKKTLFTPHHTHTTANNPTKSNTFVQYAYTAAQLTAYNMSFQHGRFHTIAQLHAQQL